MPTQKQTPLLPEEAQIVAQIQNITNNLNPLVDLVLDQVPLDWQGYVISLSSPVSFLDRFRAREIDPVQITVLMDGALAPPSPFNDDSRHGLGLGTDGLPWSVFRLPPDDGVPATFTPEHLYPNSLDKNFNPALGLTRLEILTSIRDRFAEVLALAELRSRQNLPAQASPIRRAAAILKR